MNVDSAIINAISLCSGVGMLDEGLHAGLGYLGIRSRTILYAEREAYPVSVLEARMEEGSIHPAPIWFGDFTELPARQFHGMVDCIVAGFPCQDISVAGKRAGLDGARSGLFFEIPRIADDCGAWLMLLENVSGIATATASVVDAEEGELDERAAARVVGELADLGWDAEWITISASDVGASHGRARWFCLAWRKLAHTASDGSTGGSGKVCQTDGGSRSALCEQCVNASSEMSDTTRDVRDGFDRQGGSGRGVCAAGNEMGDSNQQRTHWSGTPGQQTGCGEPAHDGSAMAHANNRDRSGDEVGACAQKPIAIGTDSELADVNGSGLRTESDGEQQSGRIDKGDFGLFAPGPASPAWERIISTSPWLSPALEPTFRSVVNGLEFDMGDCRAARLKCVGNGVVAAQAGCATAILVRRSGIGARRL